MDLKQQLTKLKNILANARNVIIFLPANPNYDQLAAGLGLYLGLLKQGKQVTIASSTPVLVENSDLVGIDKIKNSLNGKNLIISLPYEEGKIEKVSYNFEEDKFNLVIEPKEDHLDFSPDDVSFSTGGLEADLIFTVGVKDLSEIDKLYQANRDLFEKKDVTRIDNSQSVSQFGKINIVNPQLPTVSEIIVLVLKNLSIAIDKDISTNLYKGLQKGTNNFDQQIVSALTFEAAAFCLRNNAIKTPTGITQKQVFAVPAAQVSQKQSPIVQPSASPVKHVSTSPILSQDVSVPGDWLKPKIFSSTSGGKKN